MIEDGTATLLVSITGLVNKASMVMTPAPSSSSSLSGLASTPGEIDPTKPPVISRTTALNMWQRAVMTATQAVEEGRYARNPNSAFASLSLFNTFVLKTLDLKSTSQAKDANVVLLMLDGRLLVQIDGI
jgi:hypothetical protein